MNRPTLIRMASNYAQLFGGFVIGLFVIRLLLQLGEDVYGVIAVLIAGTGLVRLLREVLQTGLVPKLGEAWHGEGDFDSVYRSSLLVSLSAGLLTTLGFAILALCLPLFDIPEGMRRAALVFIFFKAIQAFITTAFGPLVTMILVREQIARYNFVLLSERSLELIGAIITLIWIGQSNPSLALIYYGGVVTAGSLLLYLLIYFLTSRQSHSPIPRLARVDRAEAIGITRSLGWNAAHVLAMNLHLRLDVILMNACFGLIPGMLFSIAGQAASYVRQLTMGLVIGVDSLTARHSRKGNARDLEKLNRDQMFLQAGLVFPAAACVWIATEELLALWLGNRLENPGESLPAIALFCRILVIGIAARSLSESWIAILTGSGNVRRFAPVVLAGALLNPVLIAGSVFILPADLGLLVPSLSFTGIFAVLHLFHIPLVTARFLQVRVSELYLPSLPAIVALATGLAAWLLVRDSHYILQLAVFLLAYGVIFGSIFLRRLRQ